MKLYKISEIVKYLTESTAEGIEGYCGFTYDDKGHLEINFKSHDSSVPEAIMTLTLLDDCGEY